MSEESFRMVIEDTFIIRCRGTVVSGIVEFGSVKKGGEVTLLSKQMKPLMATTIRGIAGMPQYEDITAVINHETVGILLNSEEIYAIAAKDMRLISDKTDRGSE